VELYAFAAMTQRVIADDGFDTYLPTACYPERRVLRVLEGAPNSVDLERIALDWALTAAEGDEEVLVAFRVDATHFKVVKRADGNTEHCLYAVDSSDGSKLLL
jgi:hypothetical protein